MEHPFERQVPQVYFNGFKVAVNAGDITIKLTLDGNEVALLHASYNVTKTFGQFLEKAIKSTEGKIGGPILSIEDLANAMTQNAPAKETVE